MSLQARKATEQNASSLDTLDTLDLAGDVDGDAVPDDFDGFNGGEGGDAEAEGPSVTTGTGSGLEPTPDLSSQTVEQPATKSIWDGHWQETAVNVISLSIIVCGWLVGLIWIPRLIEREGSLQDSTPAKVGIFTCWTLLCALGLFAPIVWLMLVVPASIIVLSIGAGRQAITTTQKTG